MKSQPNHRGVPLGLAAGLLAIAFVVGCDKNKASNTSGPGPMQGSGAPGAGSSGPPVLPEFAAGRAVFDTNCAKCHTIGGGGGAMAGGPPGGFGGGPPGGGGPPRGGPGGCRTERAGHPGDLRQLVFGADGATGEKADDCQSNYLGRYPRRGHCSHGKSAFRICINRH